MASNALGSRPTTQIYGRVIAAAVLCLAIESPLLAQEDRERPTQSLVELDRRVHPGDRLRIHQKPTEEGTSGNIIEGTLSEISTRASILELEASSGTIRFSEQDLETIELASPVTKTRGTEGALIGAGAGFGLTALLIGASCGQPDCGGTDYAFTYGALLGVPLGALIGYGVGHKVETTEERWSEVLPVVAPTLDGFPPHPHR